jgi:hypothetical protein
MPWDGEFSMIKLNVLSHNQFYPYRIIRIGIATQSLCHQASRLLLRNRNEIRGHLKNWREGGGGK